jgi:hypothetical protein
MSWFEDEGHPFCRLRNRVVSLEIRSMIEHGPDSADEGAGFDTDSDTDPDADPAAV